MVWLFVKEIVMEIVVFCIFLSLNKMVEILNVVDVVEEFEKDWEDGFRVGFRVDISVVIVNSREGYLLGWLVNRV